MLYASSTKAGWVHMSLKDHDVNLLVALNLHVSDLLTISALTSKER